MHRSKPIIVLAAILLAALPAAGRDSRPKGKEARMEDFRFMCDEIDRKYPADMFRLKGVDWRAVRAAYEKKAAKTSKEEDFLKVCVEALGKLKDGHAWIDCRTVSPDRLYDPSDRFNPGAGVIEGKGGGFAVLKVWPGSAAEEAGLGRGMLVKSIDGVPVAKAADARAQERWDRGYVSSERAARHNAVWNLLSGPKDSKVVVEYDPGDGKVRKTQLKRSFGQLLRCPKLGDYPEPKGLKQEGALSFATIDGRYGYIYIPKFSGGDGGLASIEKVLKLFAGHKGLIVDVRGNGGGGVPPVEFPTDRPIVVLIDAGTFSAGEGFVAWFGITKLNAEGHPDLVIAGQTTAGSSSDKMAVEVPSGLFTFHFSFRGRKGAINGGPDGMIEYFGVKPHREIAMDPADLALGEDTFIKTAVEILDAKTRK